MPLGQARVQVRQGYPAFLVSKMIQYRPTFAGESVRRSALPLRTVDFLDC